MYDEVNMECNQYSILYYYPLLILNLTFAEAGDDSPTRWGQFLLSPQRLTRTACTSSAAIL
jgi:hypothetical protein